MAESQLDHAESRGACGEPVGDRRTRGNRGCGLERRDAHAMADRRRGRLVRVGKFASARRPWLGGARTAGSGDVARLTAIGELVPESPSETDLPPRPG